MFRLVVIILDHKTSLPSILVNLVVGCNYFRWFLVGYFGMVNPVHKCDYLLVILLLPKKLISCECMLFALFKFLCTPRLAFTIRVSL